jgi:quercetin dioxygenase-like cupin family protein
MENTGVAVISADSLELKHTSNTRHVPRRDRQPGLGRAEKLWAGTVTIHANTKTGVHHHGHLESIIYVLKGKARIHWGEKL